MISLYVVFAIILIHFIADFICQSYWMAKNKSSSWDALLSHTLIYSSIWLLIGAFYTISLYNNPFTCIKVNFIFFIITFICHTITDYFTSRWVKKSFDKQDYHNGFVKIGFDQCLHYFQLLLTFYFLTN